jgi:hypothetical protein
MEPVSMPTQEEFERIRDDEQRDPAGKRHPGLG